MNAQTHRDGKEIDVARIMAAEMYATDEVDVPADAAVLWADGGCWVQAYVWVSDDDRTAGHEMIPPRTDA